MNVRETRLRLGLSQTDLAQLIGVHPMTIWKWEKTRSEPTPHQQAMLTRFDQAARRDESTGTKVATWMALAGVAYATYKLLEAAFDSLDGSSRP